MRRRGRPRKFNRDVALRAAMNLFRERGYDGASLEELTQAMNINSPSLYAAFGCKETLFREALAMYLDTDGATTPRALERESSAREAISAMLRNAALAFATTKPMRGCLIVLGAPHRSTDNAAVFDALASHRARMREHIRRRLQRGVTDGDVPRGANLSVIAAFYITVLNGLSLQVRDGTTRKRLLDIAECAMSAWENLTHPQPRAAAKLARSVGSGAAWTPRRSTR